MTAIINKPAPQPEIECWVQGAEPPLSELAGQVILIEMIQVNCPGCFLHALPEAIRLHEKYQSQGLKVFAIATAFEHFAQNTLENLQDLLQHGELIGDPLHQLGKAGFLEDTFGKPNNTTLSPSRCTSYRAHRRASSSTKKVCCEKYRSVR